MNSWMQKWFDGDGNPRNTVAPFIEEAWEIARTVAAVDKQLLSSQAVEAFAGLANLAYQQGLERAAEIARNWKRDWACDVVEDAAMDACLTAVESAIRAEIAQVAGKEQRNG